MTRKRNKPTESWIFKTRNELKQSQEIAKWQAYDAGKIRGKKELIDKACEWLLSENGLSLMYQGNETMDKDFIMLFRKAMEGE